MPIVSDQFTETLDVFPRGNDHTEISLVAHGFHDRFTPIGEGGG